ncbi:hypothetical protein [Aquimarina agarivorans]|uniref:hypothetical protein n=1 Tax=Aquimarina agarivorans TaxID=980584 RepID=UPI000248FCB0|nr:hypothetical protein [Aquimarina agarivorans]
MEESKIQKLLQLTFEVERMFFESAEKVDIVEFSRFLHYQSAKRNNFCNQLIAAFVKNDIEPDMTYIKKRPTSLGTEILKIATSQDQQIMEVKKCLKFDNSLINLCNNVLKDTSLPIDILDVITKEMTYLRLIRSEGAKLIKKILNIEQNSTVSKVIPLNKRMIK